MAASLTEKGQEGTHISMKYNKQLVTQVQEYCVTDTYKTVYLSCTYVYTLNIKKYIKTTHRCW